MIRKWFNKFRKKKPEKIEEPLEELDDDFVGYTVLDGQSGMLLSVLMVCGCGNPVKRVGDEKNNFFDCPHCDRPCTNDKPCSDCVEHFLFDAEAVRAEFQQGFNYDEEEE